MKSFFLTPSINPKKLYNINTPLLELSAISAPIIQKFHTNRAKLLRICEKNRQSWISSLSSCVWIENEKCIKGETARGTIKWRAARQNDEELKGATESPFKQRSFTVSKRIG